MVRGANGVEVAVVDGKSDIENGNVPEDKPSEEEDGELTSPFTIPSKGDLEKRKGCSKSVAAFADGKINLSGSFLFNFLTATM